MKQPRNTPAGSAESDEASNDPISAAARPSKPSSRFLGTMYLPFHYTEYGKRAGTRYLLQGVLCQDVVALWLAFAWLSPEPFTAAAGLLLLHLGFWAVYELGYVENDRMAKERETSGYLPPGTIGYARATNAPAAWVVACAFSAAGLWVFAGTVSVVDLLPAYVAWVAFLVGVRSVFAVYNRMAPEERYLVYPILQLGRLGGYGIIATTNIVGALILMSFVFSRWMPYIVYRIGKVRWDKANRLLMLAVFLVALPLGLAVDADAFISFQFGVSLCYFTVRARRQLADFARSVRFLPN